MTRLEKDIETAKIIMQDTVDNFPFNMANFFGNIYSFTNENLSDALDNFDIKNKNCLTVLASSDQVLDMYLRGAKNITTFDINPLTKHYFNLKKAAFKSNISKETYLTFFHPNYGNGFKEHLFYEIAQYLTGDSLKFWETLYKEKRDWNIALFLMSSDTYNTQALTKTIEYLKDRNFYELREKISALDVNFINVNIKELPKKLKENYDIMYFSNIMQYASEIFKYKKPNDIKSLQKFKDLLLNLKNHLNDNGIIINYIFQHELQKEKLRNVFTEDEVKYIMLNNYKSFNDENISSCMILKK